MPRKSVTTSTAGGSKRRVGRLATGNLEKFDIITNPLGYINKREITNCDPRFLVTGSKNMVINDGDKVGTRLGYTRDGQARVVTRTHDSSTDWASKWGLKVVKSGQGATANTGKLKVRSTDYNTDTIIYQDILSGLTTTTFNYSTWWNSTENQDVLLIVDGSSTLRMWSGGMGYVDAQAGGGTTLTLLGGGTWKQSGFLSSLAGRAVTIAGTSYTYTGGENTAVLTGVAVLPAITVGTFVSQTVVNNTSITGLPSTFTFDVIDVQNNHVWLGDTESREGYVSKSTNYIDYTYTTPVRLPTDGWKMTFDNCIVGFVQDDNVMYVTAGNQDYYKVTRNMTADGQGETFKVDKLRSGPGQAPISANAIIRVKNGIIIITQEHTVDWLTNIQNISTPQSLPLSDPIKNDFDSYELTGVTGKYINNQLYVAIPAENITRIYDFDKALWFPPQDIPVAFFSIIDNHLYGHSNSSDVSYKLEDGLTDDGVAIDFVAAFAYRQYGDRTVYKNYDEYYNELYMSGATNVTVTHRYEYGGAESVVEKVISGTDTGLIFAPAYDASLGKEPLGSSPLGSTSTDVTELNKYRCIHELKKVDFFENQILFSSSDKSAQFEILAHGPNIQMSTNVPRIIKR